MQARVTQAIEPMMAAVRLHGVVSAIHMGSVERLQDWAAQGHRHGQVFIRPRLF
jgi:hypothetical protein